MLRESGIQQGTTKNKVALFRDVKTADALRRASPGIRRLFVNSGFGLNTYDSGVPDGFYPAEDEAVRNRIIRQFIKNMKETPLTGEYCGEFDISEFLSYILAARPFPATDSRRRSREPVDTGADPAHPARRVALYRIGFAVGLAVLAFAAIKLVEAMF
ncbi:hypothetical protein [Ruegeria marisrubri]|nr:hypothetical protein [Ruegeria marisrubri]